MATPVGFMKTAYRKPRHTANTSVAGVHRLKAMRDTVLVLQELWTAHVKEDPTLTYAGAASALGMSTSTFSNILCGANLLTPQMAVRLQTVLGWPAEELYLRQQRALIAAWREHASLPSDGASEVNPVFGKLLDAGSPLLRQWVDITKQLIHEFEHPDELASPGAQSTEDTVYCG